MSGGRLFLALAAAGAVALAVPASGQQPQVDKRGVNVGNPSFMRKLVSAEKLELAAEQQYAQLTRSAYQKGALLPEGHPQVSRVRRIAQDLLPHSHKFNERAKDWRWEVNVIGAKQINAFCMPGGKIAFFQGILEILKLTDDEVAMVMGHEIAHALREHARERAAKSTLTNIGVGAAAILIGGNVGQLAQLGGNLLTLKFSRSDETEADLVGMEIAARAGYDPRSGITLWEKMSAAAKGAPPQWLSTHPSGQSRIDVIQKNLKDVMPLYEEARRRRLN